MNSSKHSVLVIGLGVLVLFLLCTGSAGKLVAGPGHSGGHSTTSTAHDSPGLDPSDTRDVNRDTEPITSSNGVDPTKTSLGKSGGRRGSNDLVSTILPGLAAAPNIHPMLVHFPIAFLVTATVFLLLSWLVFAERFLMFGRWLFWLALLTLPVVLASGFWAVGGWGGGHVTTHRNLMLLTTALAYLVFGIGRLVSHRKRFYRGVLTVGLLIVTVFMTVGADRGAYLVFVEGAGVQSTQHHHDH